MIFAKSQVQKTGKFTRNVFHFQMSKKWVGLAVLLYELDFQIETMDLVEWEPEQKPPK